jgi:hypothetical protein
MVEIDSSNVLRVVLQFLQENHFNATVETLIKESNLRLNAVTDLHYFKDLVRHGKWEEFLKNISLYSFEPQLLVDTFEQIIRELCCKGQIDAAQVLARNSEPLLHLKKSDPDRYLSIEEQCLTITQPPPSLFEKLVAKRDVVARNLNLPKVEKSRMLSLIGQAMQSQFDRFNNAEIYDSFLDKVVYSESKKSTPRESPSDQPIDLSEYGNITCVAYLKELDAIILGAQDGFITVLDAITCQIKKDLPYQQTDPTNSLIMDSSVVGMSVLGENCLVAASSGELIVWDLGKGTLSQRLSSIPDTLFVFLTSQYAWVATDKKLFLCSLRSGAVIRSVNLDSVPSCGILERNGDLYLGFKSGIIALFGVSNNTVLKRYQFSDAIAFPITSVNIFNGKIMATSGRAIKNLENSCENNTVGTHISFAAADDSFIYVLDDSSICTILDYSLNIVSSFPVPEHLEGAYLTDHALCVLKNPNFHFYL